MAEIELSVLSRQCLDRRIPSKQALIEEVVAWEEDRNKNHTKADWQFTTADARIKLAREFSQLARATQLSRSVSQIGASVIPPHPASRVRAFRCKLGPSREPLAAARSFCQGRGALGFRRLLR